MRHLPALVPGSIVFWVFAVTACVMGAAVVLLPNPVSSALALVLTLCSVAGLFLTLGAQFIAAVQVIVYAGAIMVLFVFVIMLLQLRGEPGGMRGLIGPRLLGAVLALALLVQLGAVISTAGGRAGATPAQAAATAGPTANALVSADTAFASLQNTQVVGKVLYSRFLLPFEVTSLLLLVALVGAVVLAKRKF